MLCFNMGVLDFNMGLHKLCQITIRQNDAFDFFFAQLGYTDKKTYTCWYLKNDTSTLTNTVRAVSRVTECKEIIRTDQHCVTSRLIK